MNEVTKASSNKSVTPFSTKQENAIAAIGAFAGSPGAIAGAVLGAVAGAVVEYGIENGAASREEKDRVLDQEIGVGGGDMGAPNLKHPAAKIGAYSSASMGGAAVDNESPAEGPMQAPSS